MDKRRTALVVGGLGVAGRAIVEHLAGLAEWDVVSISRRLPDFPIEGARFLSVDLLDPSDIAAKATAVGPIDHLFYAAYQERDTREAEIAPNMAMLKHAVDLAEKGERLQSILLITGTKAYGAHLPSFKTPFKETDPRIPGPNFYYDQEDYLAARSISANWRWSGLRPSAICGVAVGSPMNLIAVIACYAAVQRALGLPFSFPGSISGGHSLSQATDARLLARAAVWAASDVRCASETFNISNGDLYRLENLWPVFADHFGLETGPPRNAFLAEEMADKESIWQTLVAEHNLLPTRLSDIAGWSFGDYVFHRAADNVSDLLKCRRFGFGDFMDSEQMFIELFTRMAAQRLVPEPG